MFSRYEMYCILLDEFDSSSIDDEEVRICIQSLIILMENVETEIQHGYDDRVINVNPVRNQLIKNYDTASKLISDTKMSKSISKIKNYLFSKDEKVYSKYTLKSYLPNYIKVVNEYSEDMFSVYKITFMNLSLSKLKLEKFMSYEDTLSFFDISKKNERELLVFFSYAYKDRVYTLGFFLFFLRCNILLYVDWLFNGEKESTLELKEYLNKIMEKCDCLFFLRTINSELSLRGSRQIRQWCSWEIGNFYHFSKKKYYIETFDIWTDRNSMLETFQPLKGINDLYKMS